MTRDAELTRSATFGEAIMGVLIGVRDGQLAPAALNEVIENLRLDPVMSVAEHEAEIARLRGGITEATARLREVHANAASLRSLAERQPGYQGFPSGRHPDA